MSTIDSLCTLTAHRQRAVYQVLINQCYSLVVLTDCSCVKLSFCSPSSLCLTLCSVTVRHHYVGYDILLSQHAIHSTESLSCQLTSHDRYYRVQA